MDNKALYFVFFFVFSVRGDNKVPVVKLNDGKEIPGFGFGTWLGFGKRAWTDNPSDDAVQKSVEWAIDAGYRHIDTAYIYFIEDQVGRAIENKIKQGVVKREDLFVTSKLWNTFHAKEAVVPAIKDSLKKLKLDYLDLYLIHWPVAQHANESLADIDYLETWQGMIEALNQGLTRSIGLSNFNEKQIERVISNSNVKPAALQVEINLNLQQPSLLSYCKNQQIAVVGYTPFGALFPHRAPADAPPPRVDDAALVEIAHKHKKTVPQIVLRYIMDLGVIPIPKSLTKSRIEENFQVFDFSLTDQERATLRTFDKSYRIIPVKNWIESPYYPFEK
ncbi:aldo-keto reductase AKR2E4 [Manduca sexta]|uniref:NADP-dependent oxidoreductase domain-containing protein n=1 Tax=Manduca sexta TaxID=7130 RepID=A0A921Z6R2_MANSE|nr:aldo-keto reductase AKR2E4 [Manduca sexta]KAG6451554.1 hypothetical protein O3G_MSEX007228 [Manduca sexta]KAG6451555.1 hypothetical protein O3G_MSEX007228 [Manduca sexta]